jgi:hypothetical protein
MSPSEFIGVFEFFGRMLRAEKDSAAARRLLSMEISINREIISVARRAETDRGRLLALRGLKSEMMMLIISRSSIFSRIEDGLKSVSVSDQVDITSVDGEAISEVLTGIDILVRAAKRIAAIHGLIAVADHLPSTAYRINVRMDNLDKLLAGLSGALTKSHQ